MELAFRTALAALACASCAAGGPLQCCIRPDDVAVAVSEASPVARRRLLAGTLLLDVAIRGLATADAAAAVAGGATEGRLNAALADRGLRSVAVTGAARAEPVAAVDTATGAGTASSVRVTSLAATTTPAPPVVTVSSGASSGGADLALGQSWHGPLALLLVVAAAMTGTFP